MAEPNRKRGNPALKLALIRRIHVYISMLIAPTLLLMGATGAVQVFRIPDHHPEMVTLNKLASLHMNQTFAAKPEGPPPGGAGGRGGPARPQGAAAPSEQGARPAASAPRPAPPKPKPATVLLQAFTSLTGVGLIVTTLLGLWMALTYNREKKLLLGLLLAGIAIPVALVVAAGL